MKDRVSDKPRGFGFVTFLDEAVADKVCEEKHELQGRQVHPQKLIPAGVKHRLQASSNTPTTFFVSSDRRQTFGPSSTAAQNQEGLCRGPSTSYQRRQI